MSSLTAPQTGSLTIVSNPQVNEYVQILQPIVIYGAPEDKDVEVEEFWESISAEVESNYSLFFGS